ncbi:CGNR zinc finger domain-containing protein [Brevibacterium linens]|uniref:CGNR zinc finger domain-containing protein n=1 Tax=Brevibacterium linens TaxID=1703 RepID=UPI00351243EA
MEFEHVGNAPCLELTNSIPDRTAGDRDWLAEPATAAEWIVSLGLTPEAEPTERNLAELRRFREQVFGVFEALVSGASVSQQGLDAITEAHAQGLRTFGLRPPARHSAGQADSEPIARDWPERWSAAALTAYFAQSAIDELTGPRLDRLKSCPGCGWLFFDTSRNRSRRWCSMQTCGGRDKALRHYHRTRS